MNKKHILIFIISFLVIVGGTMYFQKPISKKDEISLRKDLKSELKDTTKINKFNDSSLYNILLDTNSKSRKLLDSLFVKKNKNLNSKKSKPLLK